VIGSVRVGIAAEARWSPVVDTLERFSRERPEVELSVLEAYGGSLWRDLRDGRLDAVLAPIGYASADLRALELGSDAWVVLVGTGHPLAGIGPLRADDLDGERIAVSGHRDAVAFDRTVADLLADLGVAAQLVSGVPAAVLHAAVAGNEVVALTTAPAALPAGVIARQLVPHRALSFELLRRDAVLSPALASFMSLVAPDAQRRPSTARSRRLADVRSAR
jgi:DNA-binding transcriptional LysR family regulator